MLGEKKNLFLVCPLYEKPYQIGKKVFEWGVSMPEPFSPLGFVYSSPGE